MPAGWRGRRDAPEVRTRGRLAAIGQGLPLIPLIPLIESAAGFDALRAIAAAPHVQRLAFGAIDFQLELNPRSASASGSIVPSLVGPAITRPSSGACLQRWRSWR